MHYLVTMAVVDALQQCLHEHRRIILGKVFPRGDLFEELTPKANIGDDVIPLLALVGLVHLEDVRVV